MKKQEEFGLILFKTNYAYNSTPKWILGQWNYISTAQREEEKLSVRAITISGYRFRALWLGEIKTKTKQIWPRGNGNKKKLIFFFFYFVVAIL